MYVFAFYDYSRYILVLKAATFNYIYNYKYYAQADSERSDAMQPDATYPKMVSFL